ncbi:GNAT family N-acetyltransferase [Rossellomorea aquimaris]|nr:GNAT family N-acetyltransferase [Rossellomorea aquimaris]WRP06286.1 GNAT family N-acetyltransferase [Rossellomorea aquimaris]
MEQLFEGVLEKTDEPYTVRVLGREHLRQILDLQETVVEELNEKSSLQPLSQEEFIYILEGNGLMIGAFTRSGLIAFRALLIPPIDDEHLGHDIGLAAEELPQVIYQEISVVHPVYRGNRLQQTLAYLIMDEMKNLDQTFTYVACTVAPFNIPSMKDKFKQGMQIKALKHKYNQQLRYIFVKRLDGKGEREIYKVEIVPIADVFKQQEILKAGWRGISLESDDSVVYGKG